MDYNSFDLDDSKAPSMQHTFTGNEVTIDQESTDFFDFIDPSHFHAVNNQQHATIDSHGHGISTFVTAKDTPTSATNNYSLMSPAHVNPIGYDTPLQTNSDYQEDEEFFTPLISPAIPPNYYSNIRCDTNFSPLTSPALRPQNDESTLQQQDYHMNHYSTTTMQEAQTPEELQERLAMIERQQQQLRTHMQQQSPGLYSSSSSPSSASSTTKHKQTFRHKIAMSSPQFNPTNANIRSPGIQPSTSTTMSPATPSLLMKLGNGLHRNNNNNLSTNTCTSTPTNSSHDSVIDNMMTLPDAILPPSKKTVINTSSSSTTTKKRRISYPRSAFTPPALLPSSQQRHHDLSSLDKNIAALVSPAALRPHTPLSPAMTASPRALKPLISPSLQPNDPRQSSIDQAAAILASKSNYQALREGQAKSLGIDFNTNIQSGMENRRSAHKAAEQKRRDTLKQNFDALRGELLEALVNEEKDLLETDESVVEREKKVKQMSKVVLLQHSYEYILRLKSDNRIKETKMTRMEEEIQRLRTMLGLEPVTDQERLAKAEEDRVEKENRLARLKRLEEMVDG